MAKKRKRKPREWRNPWAEQLNRPPYTPEPRPENDTDTGPKPGGFQPLSRKEP